MSELLIEKRIQNISWELWMQRKLKFWEEIKDLRFHNALFFMISGQIIYRLK